MTLPLRHSEYFCAAGECVARHFFLHGFKQLLHVHYNGSGWSLAFRNPKKRRQASWEKRNHGIAEHAQNLRMNISGMDGVQYRLFKSLIDNLFTTIRMEERFWPGILESCEGAHCHKTQHAFSKSAEFFQTGSNIEESTTWKLYLS